MKISSQKKQENRDQAIRAAVDLIIEKGYKAATMREIAKRAGMGDATIYNYFPAKRNILFAYYEGCFQNGVLELKKINGFNEFTFEEQIQAFFETMLSLFLPDREFIQESFKSIFFPLTPNFKHFRPVQEQYFEILDDIFKAAIEVEEIPEQIFQDMIYFFFWDFFIGMVCYWLKDDSEGFSNTTVLMDKSIGLAGAAIRAGIANRVFDIASFLFKNHILSRLDFFTTKTGGLKKIKREFMARMEEQ